MWAIAYAVGSAIIGTIASLGTASLVTASNLLGSWRIFLYAIIVSAIGVLLYNLIVDVIHECLNWLITMLQSLSPPEGMPDAPMTIGDLAKYLMYHLRIADCLAFIANTLVFKWAIVKIPFLKW